MNTRIPAFALFMTFAACAAAQTITPTGAFDHQVDLHDEGDCEGDVTFEQLPNGAAGIAAQVDVCYPFEARVADTFTLSSADDFLLNVGWWAVFWGGTHIIPADGYGVEILCEVNGRPGELVYDWMLPEAHIDVVVGDPYFVCGQLPSNPQLASGETYFISIVSYVCFPPQFGHATGDGDGIPAHFRSDFFEHPEWTSTADAFGTPHELALQIRSSDEGVLDGAPGRLLCEDTPIRESSWSRVKAHYR